MNCVDREEWLNSILSDWKVTRSALAVAAKLSEHMNAKTGQCNPSLNTLAEELGMLRQNVSKAIRLLVRRGHMQKRPTANGYLSSGYVFITRKKKEDRYFILDFNPSTFSERKNNAVFIFEKSDLYPISHAIFLMGGIPGDSGGIPGEYGGESQEIPGGNPVGAQGGIPGEHRGESSGITGGIPWEHQTGKEQGIEQGREDSVLRTAASAASGSEEENGDNATQSQNNDIAIAENNTARENIDIAHNANIADNANENIATQSAAKNNGDNANPKSGDISFSQNPQPQKQHNEAPRDPKGYMWDLAIGMGISRSLLGQKIGKHGEAEVFRGLAATVAENPADPKAYFVGCLKPKRKWGCLSNGVPI